ncbi:MAG TPA: PilT/PilU family type 4a pilus ATPase [Polyangiaceae bacterium]|nr:PilT/PilU family type 4a pilus ATPase [Polyangiaceae bacterium]
MPQIDSLLRIADSQGANELRVGSDRAPSMFADGIPKKLTVPATPTSTLKELFGELLDEARAAQLERLGRIELVHDAAKIGAYRVTITKRPGSDLMFDAIFVRAKTPANAPTGPHAGAAAGGAPMTPLSASAAEPSRADRRWPEVRDALPQPLNAPATRLEAAPHPYRATAGLAGLLGRAVALGASDVHLADGEPATMRVDGALRPIAETAQQGVEDHFAGILDEALMARLAERASLDLGLDLEGGARARVNVYRTLRGLAAAIRLLPPATRSLDDLGFPVRVNDLAELPHGLVLVTGSTGSGKSTTLTALAKETLSRRSALLVTLEDPIENVIDAPHGSLVRQREIGRDVRTFASGLRDALREDPDVILVGEMRDPESIGLALTAAETGHLVLASMHSRSAASAVERILDAHPSEDQRNQIRTQLADSLRAVLSQRLLPRQGGGRALAAEVLRVNSAVASAIKEGKVGAIRTAMQAGRDEGMIPLERHLADLVMRRVVSPEEARRAAREPTTLLQYLGRHH